MGRSVCPGVGGHRSLIGLGSGLKVSQGTDEEEEQKPVMIYLTRPHVRSEGMRIRICDLKCVNSLIGICKETR